MMIKASYQLLAVLFSLMIVGGCGAVFVEPGVEVYQAAVDTYSLKAPRDWLRFEKQGKTIFIKDGPMLQEISVCRVALKDALAFSDKRLSDGAAPREKAEFAMNELSADIQAAGCEELKSGPGIIDGRASFKITYACEDSNGLKRRVVLYGAIVEEWLYKFVYNAAARHYFERGIDDFERMTASVRLLIVKSPPKAPAKKASQKVPVPKASQKVPAQKPSRFLAR